MILTPQRIVHRKIIPSVVVRPIVHILHIFITTLYIGAFATAADSMLGEAPLVVRATIWLDNVATWAELVVNESTSRILGPFLRRDHSLGYLLLLATISSNKI